MVYDFVDVDVFLSWGQLVRIHDFNYFFDQVLLIPSAAVLVVLEICDCAFYTPFSRATIVIWYWLKIDLLAKLCDFDTLPSFSATCGSNRSTCTTPHLIRRIYWLFPNKILNLYFYIIFNLYACIDVRICHDRFWNLNE